MYEIHKTLVLTHGSFFCYSKAETAVCFKGAQSLLDSHSHWQLAITVLVACFY